MQPKYDTIIFEKTIAEKGLCEMKKRLIVRLCILLAFIGFFGMSIYYIVLGQTLENTIYAGVYLDEVYVGGLTKEEATIEYEKYISGIGEKKVKFQASEGSYELELSKIDLEVSVEEAVEEAYHYGRKGNILIRYKEIKALEADNVILIPKKQYDSEKLEEILEKETANLTVEAKNASIARVDGEFVITPEVMGHTVDIGATEKLFKEELEKPWEDQNLIIQAVVKIHEPDYRAQDFEKIDSVLGQFSTDYYTSNAARSTNLATGASKISGTVLLPGEQFSMLDTVTPFTLDNGYQNAGQYVDNELVDGIGGGICQVSTTLYNAVLWAELQVDERYPHSLTVAYVPLSMDAAISESASMDFRFTNNTDAPIYIDGYAGNSKLSFAVYGHETRDSNRTIKFESKTISKKEPGKDEETEDPDLEEGERVKDQFAHTGYYAELWKYIYVNGELQESYRVCASSYVAQAAKVRVGTKKKDEDEDEEKDKDKKKDKNKDKDKPKDQPASTEATTEAPPNDE